MNCLGRKRRFEDRWGDELFKEAYSFNPQSTVADKVNRDGLCYVYYTICGEYPEVEILNQVHDSIVYQIPLSYGVDKILEIINKVRLSMESPILWEDRSFSIPCDTQIGFNLDKHKMLEWKSAYVTKSPKEQLTSALTRYINEFSESARLD